MPNPFPALKGTLWTGKQLAGLLARTWQEGGSMDLGETLQPLQPLVIKACGVCDGDTEAPPRT